MKLLDLKPVLSFNQEAWLKMKQLVAFSKDEISWHGLVNRIDNIYYVYDIIMFPQINAGATTTTDDSEYEKWFAEQDIDHIRMHGHSHVNMGVTPSSTDREYRNANNDILPADDFYIYLIINKQGDMNVEIYDFSQNLLYETSDITVEIYDIEVYNRAKDWCKENIQQYVRKEDKRCFQTKKAENGLTRQNISFPSILSAWEQSDPLSRNYFAD